MNRISISLGAFVVVALAFASFYPGFRWLDDVPRHPRHPQGYDDEDEDKDDGSSLEQDLSEVLALLPLARMRAHAEQCARSDKQIDDTVAFFNDQGRFIWQSLEAMPHCRLFAFILQELGLDVDRRAEEFRRFWKCLPAYEDCKDEAESGGLTGMISGILGLVPQAEVHQLLRRKRQESRSFRTLLLALRSQQFHDFCEAVRTSAALQRHMHWAMESGLEVVFAIELVSDLYVYLTQEVM